MQLLKIKKELSVKLFSFKSLFPIEVKGIKLFFYVFLSYMV